MQSQHKSFPSTFRNDILELRKTISIKQDLRVAPTFLLPSSLRSKAHCCLHCSHVCGGPYFFSELVQRWHLVPMKAAMMLQYWQGLGCKTNASEAKATPREKVQKTTSYRSKLFNILGAFLTDCVGFTANTKTDFQIKPNHGRHSLSHGWHQGHRSLPLLLKFRSAVRALHYGMCNTALL